MQKLKQKLEIAQKPKSQVTHHRLFTNIHGIDIEMSFNHQLMFGWIGEKLSAYNCPIWENSKFIDTHATNTLKVSWIDVSESQGISAERWCSEADSDLEITFVGGNEIALQRDFVGVSRPEGIQIYCPYNFDDSFFNALRWLLPRHLISQQSLVLHSSSFVNKNGMAHLFVGPSGVGKTTTVSRIVGHTVLGDDMIMVSIKDGRAFAETPVLGQNPRFSGKAGTRFPIKAIHYLKQGSQVVAVPISQLESSRKLFASVLYPTWSYAKEQEIEKINSVVSSLINSVPQDELTLDKSSTFLGAIDESYR